MADIDVVQANQEKDGIPNSNTIMVGATGVKINEVRKFDELDPREPVTE